jgi:hypothetical protein
VLAGRKVLTPMSEYNKYLENVYSDESIPDHLEDIEDVQRMIAEEGYQEFSIELDQQVDEQEAWNDSREVNGILIKKACEHLDCPHTKCERSIRVGGIEIWNASYALSQSLIRMRLNTITLSIKVGEELKLFLLIKAAIEITIAIREISKSGESSAH